MRTWRVADAGLPASGLSTSGAFSAASQPADPSRATLDRVPDGLMICGVGIAPDKLSLLFQSFTQADTSITREYGGSALGLSIARKLAELMGGGVGVRSEPGQGSRFWFRVWLAHARAIACAACKSRWRTTASKRWMRACRWWP